MKQDWIDFFITLVEQHLNEIKKITLNDTTILSNQESHPATEKEDVSNFFATENAYACCIKRPEPKSTRPIQMEEDARFSKPALQYLTQLRQAGNIDQNIIEIVIHELLLSNISCVSETDAKNALRNIIGKGSSIKDLAFLEFFLDNTKKPTAFH